MRTTSSSRHATPFVRRCWSCVAVQPSTLELRPSRRRRCYSFAISLASIPSLARHRTASRRPRCWSAAAADRPFICWCSVDHSPIVLEARQTLASGATHRRRCQRATVPRCCRWSASSPAPVSWIAGAAVRSLRVVGASVPFTLAATPSPELSSTTTILCHRSSLHLARCLSPFS
ncbi:hypothetical protein Syun_002026 [Stephania yunnanensis]|uniref:Uncharacterized protein n=1 Tax=Stephania yunnanensis TaxID=152371 RepID=A0AAP0QBG8_9MAGN